MWLLLVVLFVIGPIVELYLIVQVAGVIGGWETMALLLFESLFGAWLMKRQGLGAVRRIQRDLQASRMPTDSLADGVLILLAGALLLTPGFLTDVVGFALLIPFTRAPIRAVMLRLLMRRLGTGGGMLRFVTGSVPGGRRRATRVYDTTGRATADPAPRLDRPELGSDYDGWRR